MLDEVPACSQESRPVCDMAFVVFRLIRLSIGSARISHHARVLHADIVRLGIRGIEELDRAIASAVRRGIVTLSICDILGAVHKLQIKVGTVSACGVSTYQARIVRNDLCSTSFTSPLTRLDPARPRIEQDYLLPFC